MPDTLQTTRAEIRLPTSELRDDLPFYTKVLGFRLDAIFPADNPQVAVLSGHGLRLRIQKGAPEAPGTPESTGETKLPEGLSTDTDDETAPAATFGKKPKAGGCSSTPAGSSNGALGGAALLVLGSLVARRRRR